MATQLEGFHWAGKEWRFDRLSADRLPFAQGAMRTKRQILLAEFLPDLAALEQGWVKFVKQL